MEKKKNISCHSILSSQNFLLWALSLIRSSEPVAFQSTGCSRCCNYFCSLRLEGPGLISQVFSSQEPAQMRSEDFSQKCLLFCSQLFVVIRKIYCFNTHACECQYLERTSGRWHRTPGMSKTHADMTIMNR